MKLKFVTACMIFMAALAVTTACGGGMNVLFGGTTAQVPGSGDPGDGGDNQGGGEENPGGGEGAGPGGGNPGDDADDDPIIPSGNGIVVEAPVFNYMPGTYSHDLNVEITSATEGADVYYTTLDQRPDNHSEKYRERIPVAGNGSSVRLRAVACKDGILSDESVAEYRIDDGKVSTPQFTVQGRAFRHIPGGVYHEDIKISITCTTPGASIHWTMDGTEPDQTAPVYQNPLPVYGIMDPVTISARAYADGMEPSTLVTATFAVEYPTLDPPTFDLPEGTYTGKTHVKMLTVEEGAEIEYTTDGSDPLNSPTSKRGRSVQIDATTTIKAVATKSGFWTSSIATATYIILEEEKKEDKKEKDQDQTL